MLLFQIFVNVGMTVGIMPITGIPPLMCYGGSSVLATCLAIGLLARASNIQAHLSPAVGARPHL